MKCIHCGADSLRRYRLDGRCYRCKHGGGGGFFIIPPGSGGSGGEADASVDGFG